MSDNTSDHAIPSEKMQTTEHHVESTTATKGLHVVETVHADGIVDLVDAHAVGGDFQEMPDGYYRSWSFILTFVAICLASMCAYLGWVLPANTL